MTATQRLQLEQSAKRQKINELLAIEPDALTSEQRAELDDLAKRMQEIEPELRAAIVAQGDDEARALAAHGTDGADGESAERRRLLEGVSLADYLTPASSGRGIEGRAAEVNAALEVPLAGAGGGVAVPWHVLETRAFTETAANDGSNLQRRPILQRLFGPGIMDTLGVRMDTVPVGRSEWPLITAGVVPAQAKEGTAAGAAVTATFATATLKPKRLTGVFEYTHEIAASVADIESALRRDLADAVKSKMSDLIVNGAAPTNDIPQNVQGFLATIAAPDDAAATAVFSDYAGAHAAGVDGIHAEQETEVSSLISPGVYLHAASIYQAGSGSGESGSEALKRRSLSCRASSYIPAATNAGQAKNNLFHLAGPNGGGVMRGDSVAAMWPTLEVIRDIYSKASQGVVLTWVALWDAKVAFRASAYQRQAFKIT